MLSALASVAAGAAAPAFARSRAAANVGSRTRDLEGVWTLGTYTDMERPKELAALVLTPEEAEAYERPRRALQGMLPSKPGDVGQAEAEFNERGDGLARVHGQIRSSWIIDPADGRIPYGPAAIATLGLDKTATFQTFDNPEERPSNERCLSSSAAGAPMFAAPDTNLFQVVQTKDWVAIHTEKYHEVRIVRLAADPATRAQPRSWLSESTGRWEGNTLVVETKGLRPGVTSRGGRVYVSDTTRVVERFTRTGPRELLYEFTVEDPNLYTRSWRGEMALQPANGRIFEYACHEGNYGLPGILAGARMEEREAAAKAGAGAGP